MLPASDPNEAGNGRRFIISLQFLNCAGGQKKGRDVLGQASDQANTRRRIRALKHALCNAITTNEFATPHFLFLSSSDAKILA